MEQSTNAFVQIILEEAIRVLAPIVLGLVGYWLLQLVQQAKLKLGDARWAAVVEAARFAVLAAQQSGLSGQIAQTGAAKKALALQLAQAFLKERGITVDLARLDALIEGLVFDELTKWQEKPALTSLPPVSQP